MSLIGSLYSTLRTPLRHRAACCGCLLACYAMLPSSQHAYALRAAHSLLQSSVLLLRLLLLLLPLLV